MRRLVEQFERLTHVTLILFLVVLLFFTLVKPGGVVFTGLFEVSVYRFTSGEFIGFLGYFLLVLIGLELLETIKAYLDKRVFHVEIILLVAIIAIASHPSRYTGCRRAHRHCTDHYRSLRRLLHYTPGGTAATPGTGRLGTPNPRIEES